MQQIVCPKCKAQVDKNLNFCPQCGAVLPLQNSSGLNPGERPTQVNQQHVAKAILNEGKKKQNPKAALAVGIIAAVIIIIAIVLLFVSGSKDNSKNTAAVNSNSAVSSALESSIASQPESSVEALVSEESSETSVEPSQEESSLVSVESSEESSEAPAEATIITAEKPDGWNNIYCYVYTKGNTMITNGEWPGEELTENNGKYQYQLPEKFNGEDCYIIFTQTSLVANSKIPTQYPYPNKDGFKVSEKTDYTLADFEAYTKEFKAQNS